jgi:vacuolar-type H+-ATPase subunit H
VPAGTAAESEDPLRAELHQAVAAVIAAVEAYEKRIVEKDREARIERDRILGDARTRDDDTVRKIQTLDAETAKVVQSILGGLLDS